MIVLDGKEKEPYTLFRLSGADKGRRIRVMRDTVIHAGVAAGGPLMRDQINLFVANSGDREAVLTLRPGRRLDAVKRVQIPKYSELIPVQVEIFNGEILTASADIKNLWVWGRVIREDFTPSLRSRVAAVLALWWIEVKATFWK